MQFHRVVLVAHQNSMIKTTKIAINNRLSLSIADYHYQYLKYYKIIIWQIYG